MEARSRVIVAASSLVIASLALSRWGLAVADDAPVGEPPNVKGLEALRATAAPIVAMTPAPEVFGALLEVQAWTESGFNPRASLGPNGHPGRPPWASVSKASAALQQGEARAARIAYQRNKAWCSLSPAPAEQWQFGSGGWFGLLPPNALAAVKPSRAPGLIASGRARPWDVFDPRLSVVLILDFWRRSQTAAWRKHWGDARGLKVAAASARLVSRPTSTTAQRIASRTVARLEALGYPASLAERKIPAAWPGWNAGAIGWPG